MRQRHATPAVKLLVWGLVLQLAVPPGALPQSLGGVPDDILRRLPPELREAAERRAQGSDLGGGKESLGGTTVEEVPGGPPESPALASPGPLAAPEEPLSEVERYFNKRVRAAREPKALGLQLTTSPVVTGEQVEAIAEKGERLRMANGGAGAKPRPSAGGAVGPDLAEAPDKPLRQFGYDILRRGGAGGAAASGAPANDSYVIGPGDRFRVFLWGNVNETVILTVNSDGTVTVPRVGVVRAGGLTIAQFRGRLRAALGKQYSQFDLHLSQDAARAVTVYVVGEALAPGSYATSSLSTVVNGLFVSGGPARTGSLRNVQLVRGGGPIATVDLYDFFLAGKRPGDLPLQNDDTIFVPPLGPVVGVVGNVLRPAIYEMKGDTTLRQALLMAGGVTPIAYTARVTIERVQPHDSSVALDLDIGPEGIEKSANPALDQRVTDYDLIRVRSIRQDLANAVTLRGHVVRPGVYQIKEGAKIADVLDTYDQLLFEPYLEHAEIRRLMPPDHHEETLSFNLGRLLEGDEAENIGLQPHDVITVFSKDEMEARRIVSIDGEVRNAGAYQLLEGMRLKDLVYAAGNVTTQAYLAEAEVTRYSIDPDGSHMEAEHFEVSLKQAMLDDPKHNVALRPFDHVLVRGISEFDLADVIDLTGEFRYPGRYRVNRGERLSDVIERAGGFTERAYLPAAKLTRESVRKMQQARLQELIDRQERELLIQSAREQDVVDPVKAQKTRESLKLKEKLVDKLKDARVEGRVVIKLAELEALKASEYDISVEPRDALHVPPRPTTVGVLGEVYNETSVLWEADETVQHYLGTVGGATPNADEDQMFVIKADGSVLAASQDHGGLFWESKQSSWVWGSFYSIILDPGDTIVVPQDLEQVDWIGETKDITTILFQLATAAGVVVAAAK